MPEQARFSEIIQCLPRYLILQRMGIILVSMCVYEEVHRKISSSDMNNEELGLLASHGMDGCGNIKK